MTDALVEAERAKYARIWADPTYREKAHGLALWSRCRHIFPDYVGSALDIGCGHGRLVARWWQEGIDAHGVDITAVAMDFAIAFGNEDRFHITALWDMDLGRRFDLGVCADVMEHVPEDLVAPSLERIAAHCSLVVFKIAGFGSVHLGYDLHPTVKPGGWWVDRLRAAFPVVQPIPYPTDRTEWVFRCASNS